MKLVFHYSYAAVRGHSFQCEIDITKHSADSGETTDTFIQNASIFSFEATSDFYDHLNSNLSNRECVNTTFPLSIAKEHAGAHMFA